MTRALPIRFTLAAILLAGVVVVAPGCNNDDDKDTSLGKSYARLNLELDQASCAAGPTALAIDEVTGVDVDYRYDSITLTPGRAYEIRVPAPGTFRVRFAGYDSRGRFTRQWDFETTLAADERKTEVLNCSGTRPAAIPGREHRLARASDR